VSRTVPVVVAAAGTGPAAVIPRLVAVVREPSVAHPLLREVLETLRLIASAPTAAYTAALVDAGAVNALQAIAAGDGPQSPTLLNTSPHSCAH
jgi:hypothetical protein